MGTRRRLPIFTTVRTSYLPNTSPPIEIPHRTLPYNPLRCASRSNFILNTHHRTQPRQPIFHLPHRVLPSAHLAARCPPAPAPLLPPPRRSPNRGTPTHHNTLTVLRDTTPRLRPPAAEGPMTQSSH